VVITDAYRVTRAVWPHLREQGYGRIAFVSSNSGLLGVPGSSAYTL
jgi:NAD(P)-dependent dehydrogenase (short-subunit alcohol dehydrogenase family)